MYEKIFTLATVIGGAVLFSKLSDETEENHSDPEVSISDSLPSYHKSKSVEPCQVFTLTSHSDSQKSAITLRRGDRFTCPETGENLQVRAVGGRPRKQ